MHATCLLYTVSCAFKLRQKKVCMSHIHVYTNTLTHIRTLWCVMCDGNWAKSVWTFVQLVLTDASWFLIVELSLFTQFYSKFGFFWWINLLKIIWFYKKNRWKWILAPALHNFWNFEFFFPIHLFHAKWWIFESGQPFFDVILSLVGKNDSST